MYMYQKVSETRPFVQGVQEYMLVISKIKEDLIRYKNWKQQAEPCHIWPQLATRSVDNSKFSYSAAVVTIQ